MPHDGSPRSMDAPGASANSMDRLMAPTRPSKRLQHAVSSLEAEYAALSEASAKSAVIQAMLRQSQPLLWLDNALILQRDKASRPQRSTVSRHTRTDPTFVDDDGVLDELLLESDRRRRRRLQWEVAKRIARVEREIRRQPLTERSWHVREKKRLEDEEKRRRVEELELEKRRRQHEKDERLRLEQEKKEGQRLRDKVLRVPRKEPNVQPVAAKPAAVDNVDLDFEWPPKLSNPVASSPASSVDEPIREDKHSDEENTSRQITVETAVVPDVQTPNVKKDRPDQHLKEIVRASLEDEVVSTPHAEPVKATVDFAEDDRESGSATVPEKKRDHERAGAIHNASSLGRQVLSEFRTMATSVSFGAPAVTGSRLNSDVLRRLFSDLDTDHDGHLNRIETSLALHRLQITVPAPRIVSFFKRIHAVDADSKSPRQPRMGLRATARTKGHEPLKDVINYKEFVAFVSTAFEQQQQQRIQSNNNRAISIPERTKDTKSRKDAIPALEVPAPLPKADSPIRQPPLHQSEAPIEDHEPRLVEQQDEDDVADRVLRQIPDYLMIRALAAAETPPANVQEIVRRSLENLDNGPHGEAIVQDIARDLVRSFAAKVLNRRQSNGVLDDEEADVSGLRRAAAFFDSLDAREVSDSLLPTTDENLATDWWKMVTEEQIATVVQEIWARRQESTPLTVPLVQEVEHDAAQAVLPSASESIDEGPVKIGAEPELPSDTDPEPKIAVRVPRVAEKSVQTGSREFLPRDLSPPPPPPPVTLPPETTLIESLTPPTRSLAPPAPRTTLACALLARGATQLEVQPTDASRSRAKLILADLRRQRRRRQAVAPVASSLESESSLDSTSLHESPILPQYSDCPLHQVEQHGDQQHVVHNASVTNEIDRPAMAGNDEQDDPAIVETVSSPLPIRQLHLKSDFKSPIEPSELVPSTRSSRASSIDIFSSYSSGVLSRASFFQEISGDDVWRHAARRRRERLGRRRGQRSRLSITNGSVSASGSVGADDDLSEGEVVRGTTHDDLSDGEVFGSTRRKLVRAKNTRQSTLNDAAQSSTAGSLESGEMLSSMIALQRTYQLRIIESSVSSLESGEAEVGIAAS